MKFLVAAFAALMMFGAIGAGSALAHDGGAFSDLVDCSDLVDAEFDACMAANAEAAPHWGPVGQNVVEPDRPAQTNPGFDGGSGPAGVALNRNPNCPRHWKLHQHD